MHEGCRETLAYTDFPMQHWTRIRSNNAIERLNREIRRRTRVVGTFPDGKSVLMLVTARLKYIVENEWGRRRYLELAGEARLSKTHGRRALGCMNDLSHILDPARIDMGEKLQWREMVLLNYDFISKCAGHEGPVAPVERFAEDLRALAECPK